MPRYEARAFVDQTNNRDTVRQFADQMIRLGYRVVVVSCPTYLYNQRFRIFKFECDHPNLAPAMEGNRFNIHGIKRLWDEEDTGKAYYSGCNHNYVEAVDDEGALIEPAYDICTRCGDGRD